MERTKVTTSIRLTAEAMQIRAALSRKLGIDLTAVMEMAIRKLGEAEGITPGTGDKVRAKTK